MKVGVTGHRPAKLVGGWRAYENGGVGFYGFLDFMYYYLRALDTDELVSGMALGFDTIAASAAIGTAIKLHAYVPFEGHHRKWKENEQNTFHSIMRRENTIPHIPTKKPQGYGEVCLMLDNRNKDIVDSGIDILVSLWDGSSGGTANCIKYAQSKGVPVVNLWNVYQLIMNKRLEDT